MKTKTIISIFSISLLFFISLFPMMAKAADVDCSCTGTITVDDKSKYETVLFCNWSNNICTVQGTITAAVPENNCNGNTVLQTSFQEAGFTADPFPTHNLQCTAEAPEIEELGPPDTCICELSIPTSEIGTSASCNALDKAGTECTPELKNGIIDKCNCTVTMQTTKAECSPSELSQYGNYACCTFKDGTKLPAGCTSFSDTAQTPQDDGDTAQTPQGDDGDMGVTGPGEGPTSPIPTEELPNFLGSADVTEIIGRIVKAVIGISGSAALAVFVYGGALWMFSAGNPDKVKKGRSAMVYATIGLAVIFLSYALVAFVLKALK